jgi:hypothetical protein
MAPAVQCTMYLSHRGVGREWLLPVEIRLIEANANSRHLIILTCKRTSRQVFFRVYRLEIQSCWYFQPCFVICTLHVGSLQQVSLRFLHSSNQDIFITSMDINYIAECDFALGCHFFVIVTFTDNKLCRWHYLHFSRTKCKALFSHDLSYNIADQQAFYPKRRCPRITNPICQTIRENMDS